MHENKAFYFILFFHHFFIIIFFLTKTRYLISDLYLYNIKIQINIYQNAVKYLQKITDFLKEFFLKNFFGLAQPAHVAGLDPASLVGSLAQASDPAGF